MNGENIQTNGHILKANLNEICSLTVSLSVIRPLNLTKLKLEFLKSDIKCKKEKHIRRKSFCITQVLTIFNFSLRLFLE